MTLKNQQLESIVYFLKNYYRLMVGKFHVDALEIQVSEAVHAYFGGGDTVAIFNALISETWQWFRALGSVQVWTDETVKEHLTEFFHRFNLLPQAIGRSNYELNQCFLKAQSLIDRITVLTQLSQHVANKAVTVVQSNQGIGKSTLIANYLLHRSFLKPGEYLYFNSFVEVQVEHAKFSQLNFIKLIVIDNVHWDTHELRQALSVLDQHGKKVIVISTVPIQNIVSFIIPTLSQEEITAFLIKEKFFENTITIGQKNVSLQAVVNLGAGGLFTSMRYPAKLKAICALSRRLSSSLVSTILNSEASYIARITDTFKPVPLNANQVYPLYALNTICHHPEFKGSKWISYETEDDLTSFKQNYPNDENHIWIDLDLIEFPSDVSVSVNIEMLLLDQVSHEKKALYTANKLIVFIYENETTTRSFRDYFLGALLKINQVVFFRKNTTLNLATHYFLLKIQNDKSYFEYGSNKITNLPHQDAFITYPKGSIQVLLKKEQACSSGALIVAEAGAGKSTLLKVINDDYVESQSVAWGSYHCVVLIPLNKLARLQYSNLLDVVLHFLNVTEQILRQAIRMDLMEHKILFLLDGWDELNSHDRQNIAHLLDLFAHYKHIIITSRPTDRDNLFFNPPIIYELQRFTLQQISECLYSFFDNKEHKEIANNFAQQASLFLGRPENNEALAVIGLPLQCYLLCQAWEPEYEAACRGENIKLPWDRAYALSRIELYQLFVISRMRKFLLNQYTMNRSGTLVSAEEISSLGYRYFLALQEAAYQQVFLNNPLKLGEDWFSQHILRLGLINGDTFAHKTYAEYFAALYIINLLQRDPIAANKLITEYRYRSHYRLVFEFAAGIVSYGDPIIFQDNSNLELFWQALLQAPRDCIGIVDCMLVDACYKQSNIVLLNKKFQFTNIFEEVAMEQEGEIAIEELSGMAIILPSHAEEKINFTVPKQPYNYCDAAYLIQELPAAQYHYQAKTSAATWLLSKMKNTNSFLIKEACANKIGKLGIATPEIIKGFIYFLGLKESSEYTVKESIIKNLLLLKIDLASLEHEEFVLFIRNVLQGSFDDSSISWFSSQVLTNEKIDILLQELSMARYISTQKKIFFSLLNITSEEGQPFVEKLATLPITRELGSLRYWIQYALVKAKKMSGIKYINSMLSLRYNQDFLVLEESLIFVHELINDNLIDMNNRLPWIDKVHLFAITATEKHEHKNSIASLIIALVNLNIDPLKMNLLLQSFLSRRADYGFWDCDAVQPCFRYLAPYFNQLCAEYLSHKVISSRNSLNISQLLDMTFMDKLLNIELKNIFILTCLEIYQRAFYGQKLSDLVNPVIYIKNAELSLVIDSLFNNLEEPWGATFFRQYLEINKFALTVSDECMRIYTPGGVKTREISIQVQMLLEKSSCLNLMTCHTLPEPTATHINLSTEFNFSAYSMDSLQHIKQTSHYLGNNSSNFFPSNESVKGYALIPTKGTII